MTGAKMVSLWHAIFGEPRSNTPSAGACTPRPPIAGSATSPHVTGGSPTEARRRKLSLFRASYPACLHVDTSLAQLPKWFTALQAHVHAVQANNTAVRLFREGRLEAAITELQRGLEANPYYATGYSNLGFLYMRQGKYEPAVECLMRALELDPAHQDAPDHLCDVLLALVDELAQIGLTDGFLTTQPGEKFDEYNRHIRTREIGGLLVMMGKREVFKADGWALATESLLELVMNAVQRKMGAACPAGNLRFAWQAIDGWNLPGAVQRLPPARST
jgi:tetratricopeptide (TPR) repeat protein